MCLFFGFFGFLLIWSSGFGAETEDELQLFKVHLMVLVNEKYILV